MESKVANKNPRGLFNVIEDYFGRMLEEVSGMKCLILDNETKGNGIYLRNSRWFQTVNLPGIISLIISQSQILKKNVYLIETMEKQSSEKLLHLNAMFFVRPTEENVSQIIEQIKSLDNRRFNEYNLCNCCCCFSIDKTLHQFLAIHFSRLS